MSLDNSERCNRMSVVDEELAIMPTAINHLKRHLMWPKAGENRLRYYMKALVVMVLYTSMGACCAGYIYDVRNRGVDIGYERELASSVSVFSQSILLFWLMFRQTSIYHLLKELVTFDNFRKPTSFEKTEYKLKLISNIFYIGTICGLTAYLFVPVLELSRCEDYNRVHEIQEVCGITAPIWSILHIDGLPMTYIYISYQAITLYCGMPAVAMIPLIAYGVHEHMAIRIEYLRENLRLWNERQNKRKFIREFIRQHQYTIRLMNKVDAVFSLPLCIHVFVTSSVLTLILHEILTPTWRIPGGAIMHMLIWLLVIYVNTFGAQKVKDESLSVADDIYNDVKWYNLNVVSQRDLHIIICRAQKALVVSTGAFGHMDFTVLLTVMKGLYTFCIVSLCKTILQ